MINCLDPSNSCENLKTHGSRLGIGEYACPRYPFAGNGSQLCSARQAEAIAFVLRSAGAGRPAAASSAEELVVRLCCSAEATSAVLGARRAGSSTTSSCSEHLVCLSRKAKSARAPAQTKARSKRIGLIGRRPQKLIPRNRLQRSQFQGIKLLRMILGNTERVSVDFTL